MRYRVFTDGACRGNPGQAALGVSIEDARGKEVGTASETIGITTNNVAEYNALFRALEMLEEMGVTEVEFNLDSQLIVRQLNGEYRVRDAKMRTWYTRVREKLLRLDKYDVRHIPREENTRADALANEALDALTME